MAGFLTDSKGGVLTVDRRRRERNSRSGGLKRRMSRGIHQKFIAVDGEGFSNGYCLLDSSVDSYPRLYNPDRMLETQEIFDWLWELSKTEDAVDADIVLYGASYDFNNWLRSALVFNDEDHPEGLCDVRNCLCHLVDGDVVWVPPCWGVQWMRGYRFVLRKYGETRQRKWGASGEVVFWDVLPFFQCGFIKALENYGIEVPEIIREGKDARGSFEHADIDKISRYNKLECSLLLELLDKMKLSMASLGLKLTSWNGPGAAAKALLRKEGIIHHNGRVNKNGGYSHPEELSTAMLSAYAGGMCRRLQIGRWTEAYGYDINSAYPTAMFGLPCLSHGRWRPSNAYVPGFGIWLIDYHRAKARQPDYIDPLFCRNSTGAIEYPAQVTRWAYGCEVEAVRRVAPRYLKVLRGWVWEPDHCDHPRPFDWVHREGIKRLAFKRQAKTDPSKTGHALVLKLSLNSLYGSVAQARGSEGLDSPPWSQQLLWAGWITASTRMKLWLAAMKKPESVIHMATDGLILSEKLNGLKLGDKLGEWEESVYHDFTVVQYGVYFHREGQRTRGFVPPEVCDELLSDVYNLWAAGTGFHTVPYTVNSFVTAGEVRQKIQPYENWCEWVQREKLLDITGESFYEAIPDWPTGGPDSHVYVRDRAPWHQLMSLNESEPYKPKWGKSYDWPVEYDDDILSAMA